MMMKVDLIADQLLARAALLTPRRRPLRDPAGPVFEGLSAEDFVTFTGRSWRTGSPGTSS